MTQLTLIFSWTRLQPLLDSGLQLFISNTKSFIEKKGELFRHLLGFYNSYGKYIQINFDLCEHLPDSAIKRILADELTHAWVHHTNLKINPNVNLQSSIHLVYDNSGKYNETLISNFEEALDEVRYNILRLEELLDTPRENYSLDDEIFIQKALSTLTDYEAWPYATYHSRQQIDALRQSTTYPKLKSTGKPTAILSLKKGESYTVVEFDNGDKTGEVGLFAQFRFTPKTSVIERARRFIIDYKKIEKSLLKPFYAQRIKGVQATRTSEYISSLSNFLGKIPQVFMPKLCGLLTKYDGQVDDDFCAEIVPVRQNNKFK